MTLLSSEETYLKTFRKWWWSPVPFWEYTDSEHRGWAHMVDKHPGLFNLAWVMSGVQKPPQDYTVYAPKVRWVFNEAMYIPMYERKMADWALDVNLKDFHFMYVEDARRVRKWKFHTPGMSYEVLLRALNAALHVSA